MTPDADAYLRDPIGDLDAQTAGFEAALERYFAACARAKPSACRWTGGGSSPIPARSHRVPGPRTPIACAP